MRKRDFISYTTFAFSEAEVKRLLDACGTLADRMMILLSVRYGFRREDVVNLKVGNINIEQQTLTFHEKKKNRDRTIPIEYDVAMDLKRYIATIPKNDIYLLPFRDGTTAWHHLQDVCSVANIPVPPGRTGRPFHALRGTCLKLRQKQGWTVNECASLVGDEPGTVFKHYLTTTPAELATKMRGA
jgi:integrase